MKALLGRSNWRALLIAIFIGSLYATTSVAANTKKTALRVGWAPNAPYQYAEKMAHVEYIAGVDIALARRIAELDNQQINLEEDNWGSNLEKVRSGEIDMTLGAFFSEERAEYAWFSEPYRTEHQVLFFDPKNPPDFSIGSSMEFVEQVRLKSFRLGIVRGIFYGSEVTQALNSPRFSAQITQASSEADVLELLLNGNIDGFISDRLTGQKAINQLGIADRVREHPLVLYESDVHAMFSRTSSSIEQVNAFNKSLAELRDSGEYASILRGYTAPILLSIAISGDWFLTLDIIGTIAFAVSGLLIARKESYSLVGAFILAALPAVGGGILRDLLIGRNPLGVLETPLYLTLVMATVMTGYLVNSFLKFLSSHFDLSFDKYTRTLGKRRYLLPRNIFEVFDAIGLASFTVIGVVVASNYRAEPLWMWGPLLAAITAAGGGVLRDVLRADANNPTLKTSFYAEIAVFWGLVLSLFLHFNALDVGSEVIRAAVIITVVGAFTMRFMVVITGTRSPQF
ncbi:TRIC cation channel family protein [Flavobacteriaceae bacterium]|nr:TRIC cation channel family protein [Flavobacteriaceae bacterium]